MTQIVLLRVPSGRCARGTVSGCVGHPSLGPLGRSTLFYRLRIQPSRGEYIRNRVRFSLITDIFGKSGRFLIDLVSGMVIAITVQRWEVMGDTQ